MEKTQDPVRDPVESNCLILFCQLTPPPKEGKSGKSGGTPCKVLGACLRVSDESVNVLRNPSEPLCIAHPLDLQEIEAHDYQNAKEYPGAPKSGDDYDVDADDEQQEEGNEEDFHWFHDHSIIQLSGFDNNNIIDGV